MNFNTKYIDDNHIKKHLLDNNNTQNEYEIKMIEFHLNINPVPYCVLTNPVKHFDVYLNDKNQFNIQEKEKCVIFKKSSN